MIPADHTNPGTVDPARQAHAPVLPSTTSPCTCPLAQSSGEAQRPAASPGRAAPSTLGLPKNVDASAQNLSRPVPPAVATTTPPAKNARPGDSRPGGLAVDVIIK